MSFKGFLNLIATKSLNETTLDLFKFLFLQKNNNKNHKVIKKLSSTIAIHADDVFVFFFCTLSVSAIMAY